MDVETLHPQTKRHLQNSQRLRAAAIREFARHGLQGAKVSSIVAAAQLTQPSFYRTWKSKEAAYSEIVNETRAGWRKIAGQVLDGPPELSLETRLHQGLERLYYLLTIDLELTRMVMEDWNKSQDRYLPFIEIYTQVFEDAQSHGYITVTIPPETLAQAYTAITRRFFMARLYASKASVEETATEVTQIVLPLFRKEDSK